jgi:hypothetical protein
VNIVKNGIFRLYLFLLACLHVHGKKVGNGVECERKSVSYELLYYCVDRMGEVISDRMVNDKNYCVPPTYIYLYTTRFIIYFKNNDEKEIKL